MRMFDFERKAHFDIADERRFAYRDCSLKRRLSGSSNIAAFSGLLIIYSQRQSAANSSRSKQLAVIRAESVLCSRSPMAVRSVFAAADAISNVPPKYRTTQNCPVPPCTLSSTLSQPSITVGRPLLLFLRPRLLAPKTLLRGELPSTILCSWGANDCQRMEEHPMSDLERIIRLKTVLARTGLSRSTMYRKIAEGTFPCQLKISVHGAGWRESAVNRWIANPIAYREEPQEQSCP
jgi:prophage regulatory protein